jgi:hypothetical protein
MLAAYQALGKQCWLLFRHSHVATSSPHTCSSVDTPGSQDGPDHVPSRLKHTCNHTHISTGSLVDAADMNH